MKQRPPSFSIIAAMDEKRGIGKNNQLPWKINRDMAYFKTLTTAAQPGKQNLVIMGRKTWESLPKTYRPLPNRINVVLSKNDNIYLPLNVLAFRSFDVLINNLAKLQRTHNIESIFIIGGGNIYREAIKHPYCDTLYLTHIHGNYHADTFFPEFENQFTLFSDSSPIIENNHTFQFTTWKKYFN